MATPLNFPMFFAFGAGKPSITTAGGAVNDIDAMIAAGADGVRCSIAWDLGDPTHSGKYVNTDAYDALIQYCNQKNFKVILQVALGGTFGGTSTTDHLPGQAYNHNANADGSPGHNGPINVPKLLSAFMVDVGTRYQPGSAHGEIYMLEMGNEPNHGKWDVGTINGIVCSGVADSQKGTAYFEYLARVYPPLHALGVTVLSGGLGGIGSDTGDQPADDFLNNIYAASFTVGATTYHGTDGLWDHFNFHPYCYPDDPTADLARKKGRGWWLMVNKIVPILTSHGHISKGIVITEVGNPTGQPDIVGASKNMTAIHIEWNGYSYGGGMGLPCCWFNFQDGGAGATKGRLFGVVDPVYAKKQPFWQTYHDLSINGIPGGGGGTGPTLGQIGINVAAQTAAAARVKAIWDDASNGDPRTVRVPISWAAVQPFPASVTNQSLPTYKKPGTYDTFNWTAIDALIDEHEAKGNLVWAMLGEDTPNGLWPDGAVDGHCYPNRDAINGYRDYANFVYSFVARYCGTGGRNPDTVVAVELENEPNNGFGLNKVFVTGRKQVSAVDYWALAGCAAILVKTGVMLSRTTRAAFSADDVKVISAGCGPVAPGTANAADQWHQAGLTATIGGATVNVLAHLDGASAHLYGLQCPPFKIASWNQRTQVLPSLRAVLDTAGFGLDGSTPITIWIGEDGPFTRKNNTPTNTADTANCGTFGSNPGDQSLEVTETTAAIRIRQTIDGANTALDPTMDGVDVATFRGAGVLKVADTSDMPAANDVVWVRTKSGIAAVSYTGTTATTFAGCTTVYGTGKIAGKGGVYRGWYQAAAKSLGIEWLTWYEEADTGTDWANSGGLNYANGTAKPEPRAAFVAALGFAPAARAAPHASISSPADDPTHANGLRGDVFFICPSTDDVDDPEDLIVKLYRDSGATLVGSCAFSPLSGWFYESDTPTEFVDGNYAFVTKVTNTAGLTTTSAVVHVTIDNAAQTNVAPTVEIVSLTLSDGTVYTTPGHSISVSRTITAEISVSDDHDSSILPDLYLVLPAGRDHIGQAQAKPGAPGRYVIAFDTTDDPNSPPDYPLVAVAVDSGGLVGTSP